MSSATIKVYGNLALACREAEAVRGCRAIAAPKRLSVVAGAHREQVIARERQLWAPDAYGMRSAKAATATSVVRAVAVAAAAVVLLVVLVAARIGAAASSEAAAIASAEHVEVAVGAGESLWSIAEAHPVKGLDTSRTVELIREWNDLDSSMLRAGMVLSVPASR